MALARCTDAHRWTMSWTNAGHPSPILVTPDGTTELLEQHDPLFGFDFGFPLVREDHDREIEPGSLLFLCSDGLVERSGIDLDAGIQRVRALLGAVHRRPLHEIADAAMSAFSPSSRDDVVTLVVQFDKH